MIQQVIKGVECIGLTYNYFDVVVQEKTIVKQIKVQFSELTELMLGSDNASCLASHDSIPYILHTNTRLNGVKVTNWVYTEACTGKNRLDSHFSFVNLLLKGFTEDGNDILNENDVYAALNFQGGTILVQLIVNRLRGR